MLARELDGCVDKVVMSVLSRLCVLSEVLFFMGEKFYSE